MKLKIQAIFCIISLYIFIQCKDNKPNTAWDTYNGESFMIDYPTNWDIDSTGQFNVQAFTCLSPETGNAEETLSFGIVMIIDSTDLKTAIDNFMGQWDANTSKALPTEIGNQQGMYVEANTEGIIFKNYFLKKDNILYYMFFAGHPQAVKLWGGNALKMVNSFRIINHAN